MADLGIEWTGVENVIEQYARIKGVPVWKVLRNAAKDCVQGAYMVTPRARPMPGPNPYAFLPGRGKKAGKAVYVRIDRQRPSEQRRLEKFRLARPRAGYALAAFIPVMRALGFKRKKPPRAANERVLGRIGSFFARRTGGDEFKAAVDNFRQAHTHANQPGKYSYAVIGKRPERPVVALAVNQYALTNPEYRDWATRALRNGMMRAARIIIRDMTKLLEHPEQIPPDTL